MSDPFLPQRPVVTAYPKMPAAFAEAEVIAAYLNQKGLEAPCGSLIEENLRKRIKNMDFDLLIAVGGDGTMLRAGHLCASLGIPILGINLGRLGFLIQVQQNEWHDMFERLFKGEAWIENRMMLQVEHIRAGERIGSWQALNEAVVGRGQYLRPVKLAASADGHLLTTYIADGLIAATPTGSTAYALAAGGPILPPELRNILLVAVAPHLSIDRAIVLSEGSSVSIVVNTDHQAVLSPDGQVPIGLADGDRVEAYASEHTIRFLRFQDPGYFYRNLTPHMSQNPSTGNSR